MTTPLRLLRIGSPDGSLKLRWSDGARREITDPDLSRELWWTLRAMQGAQTRLNTARFDAAPAWTAACEAIWWASALDDKLHAHADGYAALREIEGASVVALRWARHRITHSFGVAVSAGPAVNYYGGEGRDGGYPLVRSPGMTWKTAEDILAGDRDRARAAERSAFDARLAGRSVPGTLVGVSQWLGSVLDLYEVQEPDPHPDRSVLS